MAVGHLVVDFSDDDEDDEDDDDGDFIGSG